MSEPQTEIDVPGIDTSKPNIARVHDYWLGGKNNFLADRTEGRRLVGLYPPLQQKVREGRMFLHNAVSWLAAERGITQFLDLGSGLPTATNTHEIARAAAPQARVAYVDNDAMAHIHAQALLAKGNGVAAVQADLTDIATVVSHPGINRVIDWSQPVVVIMTMVLHFFPDHRARMIAAAYSSAAVHGSYVVISAVSGDRDSGGLLAREYAPAKLYNHSPEQIRAWFDPLHLINPPGLVDAHAWMPAAIAPPPSREGGHVLAGVGRV